MNWLVAISACLVSSLGGGLLGYSLRHRWHNRLVDEACADRDVAIHKAEEWQTCYRESNRRTFKAQAESRELRAKVASIIKQLTESGLLTDTATDITSGADAA